MLAAHGPPGRGLRRSSAWRRCWWPRPWPGPPAAAAGLARPADLRAWPTWPCSLMALPLLACGRRCPGLEPAAARPPAPGLPTWDCGYSAASPGMQYTASSFADGLVSGMPACSGPRSTGGGSRACSRPRAATARHVPDPVLDRARPPRAWTLAARGLGCLRFLQSGQLPLYLLYVLLTLSRSSSGWWPDHDEPSSSASLHILLHLLTALLLPPLIPGLINKVKALMAGRDRARRCCSSTTTWPSSPRKQAVFSRTTTWVFLAGPVAVGGRGPGRGPAGALRPRPGAPSTSRGT